MLLASLDRLLLLLLRLSLVFFAVDWVPVVVSADVIGVNSGRLSFGVEGGCWPFSPIR